MNKAKLKYVKYTKQELDRYVRDKNSCITLTNSEMHVGFPPWGFANFQETLTNIISRDKIGKFDTKLNGIVLEVRNIKVFGNVYPVYDDDPINHINIKANFYVFQPRIGTVIKGTVKHISHGHVAVIIYRVFNVSIRFNRAAVRDSLEINQQISFRIKKFDLTGAMPYIEGELIETTKPTTLETVKKHLKFEDDDENPANGGDSGISTEENDKRKPTNMIKKNESSSEESSESSSDSESKDNTYDGLIADLFTNVKVKKEKVSDSDSSSEDEEENSRLPISISKIKKEKNSPEKSGSSSSSESSSDSSSSSDSDTQAKSKLKRLKNCVGLNKTMPLPSTSKIKEEPKSEDESEQRKKRRKTTNNASKSFKSITNDLFDSFLK